MSRRNRKSQGKLSVLDFIDSEFEDIEKNFYENPVVQSEPMSKKLEPKKTKDPEYRISQKKNGTRTVHRTVHKPSTNGTQSEHNHRNRNTNETQTEHATRHNSEHKRYTNGVQTAHKSTYPELVGLQRNLALYFFEMSKFSTERNTPKITIDHINESTKMTKGSIKTTLARLKQKGIVSLVKYKDGRGGWGIYRLSDEIFNEILKSSDSKWNTNGAQTEHKRDTKGYTQPDTSPPSSSSINTNTTTRTQNLEEIQIPPILKEKGFGLSHLKQILGRHEFSILEIQGFLEAYAFDLQSEQGKKLEARGTNLIGYFFGALKNGGYNTLSKDFKTSEDQAREDQLKALEERKKIREEQEKRIFELKFAEWLDTKGKDELVKLVPPVGEYLGAIHRSGLKDFFRENILDNQGT